MTTDNLGATPNKLMTYYWQFDLNRVKQCSWNKLKASARIATVKETCVWDVDVCVSGRQKSSRSVFESLLIKTFTLITSSSLSKTQVEYKFRVSSLCMSTRTLSPTPRPRFNPSSIIVEPANPQSRTGELAHADLNRTTRDVIANVTSTRVELVLQFQFQSS